MSARLKVEAGGNKVNLACIKHVPAGYIGVFAPFLRIPSKHLLCTRGVCGIDEIVRVEFPIPHIDVEERLA